MAHDSYCAICGGALGSSIDLEPGSNSDRTKRIRKKVIEHGLRQRVDKTREQYHRDDSDSDSGLPESEHLYSIEHSYDPEVVACRDVTLPNHERFLGHVRLVMYDPNIKESSQYFISGQAEADDFGWGTLHGGGHPERPDEEFENVMYRIWEDDQSKSFPCHGLCLQIAAKAILGKADSSLLDPEVLYKVMDVDLHGSEDDTFLQLDYGDITTGGQYWECEAGEEYCIMNPLEFYGLHMRTLLGLTIKHEPSRKDNSAFSAQKVVTDPFRKLSNELIHHVTDYSDGNEVFILRQASAIVHAATGGNSFWKSRVQKDMEWLWVPHDLFGNAGSRNEGRGNLNIDWMKVYLLFDNVTARPYGMSGVYMGLANRRRIWNACEELKRLYVLHVAKSGRSLTNPNPGRRTWGLDSEIDSLWSEAWDKLASSQQWLCQRGQVDSD